MIMLWCSIHKNCQKSLNMIDKQIIYLVLKIGVLTALATATA